MHSVGYTVYHHPPFLLIDLHSAGRKCKLIHFSECNLRIFVATYCFVPPFRKAKFCVAPSRDIVETECALGKEKGLRNTAIFESSIFCI
jgi:hypothetical protein